MLRAALLPLALVGSMGRVSVLETAYAGDQNSSAPHGGAVSKDTARDEYRLVAARISITRGRNLEVKLVPTKGKDKDLVLRFPAHSLTPHEKELRKAVYAAVPLPGGSGPDGWTKARAEVVFSLPKESPSPAPKWWAQVRVVSQKEKKEQ